MVRQKSRAQERSEMPPKATTQTKKSKFASQNKVAYTITDPKFGTFEIRETTAGWWKVREKVELLIAAKKVGANDTLACYYAGLNEDDLKYFLKIHPQFLTFLRSLTERPKFKALMTIEENLSNPEVARWYLERKMKDEFSSRAEITGANGGPVGVGVYGKLSDEELDAEIERSKKCLREKKK